MAKSRAAQTLGRKRWKGKTKAERQEHARMMGRRSAALLSREEHSARMSELGRKGAAARWGKADAAMVHTDEDE